MARISITARRYGALAFNLFGAAAVAFTLGVNLSRGTPVVSLAASLVIALVLYLARVRTGRPRGIAAAGH